MPEPSVRPPAAAAPPFGLDARAVTDAYRLGELVEPPRFAARGELGRIWRFTTATGEWAVKELLLLEPDEPEARSDVAFQLAAADAGVSLPRPRLRPDGAVLTEVAAAERASATVRVYEWVDLAGHPPAADAAEAAHQLGLLHAAPFPDTTAVDPWYWEPVPDERWTELSRAGRTSDASWTDALRGRVDDLVAATALVAAAGTPASSVRCHLDFNPQNVLVTESGRTVVVDWENSGPGAVDQELASAIAEFVPDPAATPDFVRAYLAGGGPVVALAAESFSMTLAVQAHLLEWYAARALDLEVSAEDRARASFWTADICAQLFTVKRVRAWVRAAGPLLR